MWPDYGTAVFWDIDGANCGDCDCLFLADDTKIDLSGISGLKEWFSEWDSESLYHTKGWGDLQWQEWWQRGFELAKQIKKLLPETVDFYYMWKTDTIWKLRPEETNDGGIFAGEIPLEVKD